MGRDRLPGRLNRDGERIEPGARKRPRAPFGSSDGITPVPMARRCLRPLQTMGAEVILPFLRTTVYLDLFGVLDRHLKVIGLHTSGMLVRHIS